MKIQLLLVSAFAMSLTACQKASDDGKSLRAPFGFESKSCAYEVNEGEAAETSYLKKRDIIKVSFGREFNHALFKGIAKANISDSLEFIRATNAEIYKAPAFEASDCSQNLFSIAKPLPQDLKELWEEFTKDEGPGKGITLGVYLGKGLMQLKSNADRAVILIRENTNRWTLVHEFMHHLFNLQEAEEGFNIETAYNLYFQSLTRWQVASEDLTSSRAVSDRIEILLQLVDRADVYYANFSLEEMTIEKFLMDQFKKGNLKYVPLNGTGYIHQTGKASLENYTKLLDRAISLIEKADQFKLVTEKAKLDKTVNLLSLRINEITKIMTAYPLKESRQSENGLAATAEIHMNCSHHKIDDKTDEIMNNLK